MIREQIGHCRNIENFIESLKGVCFQQQNEFESLVYLRPVKDNHIILFNFTQDF